MVKMQNHYPGVVVVVQVVVSGRMSQQRQDQVRQVVLGTSTAFGANSPATKSFK